MKVGIVSDSHGKTKRLGRALELLKQHGPEVIVHCGDILSEVCVEQLGSCGSAAYLVAGNMDRSCIRRIQKSSARCGVHFERGFVSVPIGENQHLAATHGHSESLLEELVHDERFRYVCHGHTHQRRDETCNRTRLLNPGALYQPKGTKDRTVLLLDTETDVVEEIIVPR